MIRPALLLLLAARFSACDVTEPCPPSGCPQWAPVGLYNSASADAGGRVEAADAGLLHPVEDAGDDVAEDGTGDGGSP